MYVPAAGTQASSLFVIVFIFNQHLFLQIAKAKVKVEAEAKSEKIEKSESKEMKLPLLNGFSNGSTLSDVRQRVAGAVASQ